jgi:hypothetical protein
VENEISDVENMSGTILSTEQEIGLKNTKKWTKYKKVKWFEI